MGDCLTHLGVAKELLLRSRGRGGAGASCAGQAGHLGQAGHSCVMGRGGAGQARAPRGAWACLLFEICSVIKLVSPRYSEISSGT